MSMESVAWHSMYTSMQADADRRPFSRRTLRRIAAFARPHRRRIAVFVAVGVAVAVVTVATPLLAGRVVDAIVTGAAAQIGRASCRERELISCVGHAVHKTL